MDILSHHTNYVPFKMKKRISESIIIHVSNKAGLRKMLSRYNGSRLKGMPQKDLINIRNNDVRHLIPKVYVRQFSKMAPKY